jgi:hypothetical protein
MTEALVLLGRLVTFDRARPEVEDGALYLGADERIAAVQSRTDPAPDGFESARRVRTGGAIYRGLIDLHSHVVYNILSLWSPPGTTEPFVNRKDWPKHGDYEGTVSDPANALGALAGKAHLKYCEVKAVIGGTTAIQGWRLLMARDPRRRPDRSPHRSAAETEPVRRVPGTGRGRPSRFRRDIHNAAPFATDGPTDIVVARIKRGKCRQHKGCAHGQDR